MAIRYKFRSSMNFDTVDIDGRPSISIRDLKSKIVHNKKLNTCHDFDLVFSDAVTGQEYNNENFQILSGSSVIIKRVPAGSVPLDVARSGSFLNIAIKGSNEIKPSQPKIDEINFDDFGVDLCPVPEGNLSCSDIDVDKKICVDSERENIDATRSSEPHRMGCQKLEASNASEAIPRGPVHTGVNEDLLGTESKPDVQHCVKLEQAIKTNPPAMQNANFPSELKCSLCNTLFKEAVMIPCCQHSFCEKCIRLVLVEKARCPKCFSSKCRLQDLLPNVSLRQAIEHFLASQNLISASENAYHQYAPDGESGIQAKDVSCAVTNLQREPEMPDSPSATGRGSNQIVVDSAYDSVIRNNTGSCVNRLGADKLLKSCSLPQKMKQIDAEGRGSAHPVDFIKRPVDLDDFSECHGESQPIHVEAEFCNKRKRGLWVDTSGADKSFIESGRHKKDRTCYKCGSPDHLIRDCPAASSPNPMLQPGNAIFPGAMHGYASPYWNGLPLPHVRPFANIYGNQGMMPFNPTMAPTTPFAVPTYMPSMFGGLPAYGGSTRMGGPRTPVGVHPGQLCRSGVLHNQDCEKKQKLPNINMSEQSREDDEDENVNIKHRFDEAERLHDRKSHFSKERSVSFSDDSFTYRSYKRHRRDSNLEDDKHSFDEKYEKNSRSSNPFRERRPYHQNERLSSEVEDIPSSSSWHGDERHKKHSRQSKKHNEREQVLSDSSWSRHPMNREKDGERKKQKSDVKRHNRKHDCHSDSGLEPSYSSDRKKKQREKDLSHGSRHARHNLKSMDDDLGHDRWLMARGPDKDHGDDYHCSKRRRDD